MKEVFKKTPSGMVPSCERSQRMFDKMPVGEKAMVDWTKNRIYGNHQRFFILRDETFEIQDSFDNEELWRKQLQIMAGHFDEVIVPLPDWSEWLFEYLERELGGVHKEKVINKIKEAFGVQLWAKSISYEKMDETAFRDMFSKAVSGFLKNYAPQMDDETFMKILDFD